MYSKYYNFMEWNFIMNNNNFQYTNNTNYIFQNLTPNIRYDNPFYLFYKNIK